MSSLLDLRDDEVKLYPPAILFGVLGVRLRLQIARWPEDERRTDRRRTGRSLMERSISGDTPYTLLHLIASSLITSSTYVGRQNMDEDWFDSFRSFTHRNIHEK
jgi:hypothetical protein